MDELAAPPGLSREIKAILRDPAFDLVEAPGTRAEAILAVLSRSGAEWRQALGVLLQVLLDEFETRAWQHAVEAIWLALGRITDFPDSMVDYTVAVINHCLQESDLVDGNLVWSITRRLKRVDYNSEYDPFNDDAVYDIIKRLSRKRA